MIIGARIKNLNGLPDLTWRVVLVLVTKVAMGLVVRNGVTAAVREIPTETEIGPFGFENESDDEGYQEL